MSIYNNTLQRNTVLVSFVGMERCDILLYVAKILTAEKKEILIIDNSCSKDLFLSVTHDPESSMTDYRGITIGKDIACSPELFINYEYVLIYHGFNVDDRMLGLSDKVYVFTNYERSMSERLAKLLHSLPEGQGNVSIVYRDKISHKVPEKLVLKDLGISYAAIKEQYSLPFDKKDYSLYLFLTHNGSQSLKNASNAYVTILFSIVADILGIDKAQLDKKTIQRMIKRTR